MIDAAVSHVLRVMDRSGVRCLLTGGQACVVYGAAEFSKDVDFVVLADSENFEKIQSVAGNLRAETIAVPPFERAYLDEGLAIHLRCTVAEANGMRVDLMSRMRNVDPFPEIWKRRSTFEFGKTTVEIMGVVDLVKSKKTQRLKDWPMIQRLMEVHFEENKHEPSDADIEFWLSESLTEKILIATANRYPDKTEKMATERPLLREAIQGDSAALEKAINSEIEAEKEADRRYWEPLKARLGELRRAARRDS